MSNLYERRLANPGRRPGEDAEWEYFHHVTEPSDRTRSILADYNYLDIHTAWPSSDRLPKDDLIFRMLKLLYP